MDETRAFSADQVTVEYAVVGHLFVLWPDVDGLHITLPLLKVLQFCVAHQPLLFKLNYAQLFRLQADFLVDRVLVRPRHERVVDVLGLDAFVQLLLVVAQSFPQKLCLVIVLYNSRLGVGGLWLPELGH